ncbi:SIR2 family protein [Rhizobium sp. BR 315]|uniref:SIR2 family protein n=1 Tax=Rhizobium sp. BR 315 TaxID=3040014 RepID=UPI003D32D1D9
MRFCANGPFIPDELLISRDRGDVVFFCGAGVSQARAKLDNFVQLARKVIERLGAGQDSPARRLLEVATNASPIAGVGGFIATDRVFSLLEREFLTADVQAAVAAELRPTAEADKSAHRLILDLAAVSGTDPRLVTTNFDLLFEESSPGLPSVGPGHLPDPRRADFRGIVHLHGRVTADYLGPDEDGFVLSSADFGKAYLADGWATQFMQSLLRKYSVVFLGYSADDPPVQYLLEALKSTSDEGGRMYAFQSGEGSTAAALWEQKGVTALAYDPANGYRSLWETLEAWAVRARNVDTWYSSIIEAAAAGPENLEPHVRGQVAHLVSTEEGMHQILDSEKLLPASWLKVMDPKERYERPYRNDDGATRSVSDPFDRRCLDSDEVPEPVDPDRMLAERKIPSGAWDAFSLSKADLAEVGRESLTSFRGQEATVDGTLPRRLGLLSQWLWRVSSDPEALEWAIGQQGFHNNVRAGVLNQLEARFEFFQEGISDGWQYLFRAWDARRPGSHHEIFRIEQQVGHTGWTEDLVRQLALVYRPRLIIERSSMFSFGRTPPRPYSLKVEYPKPHRMLEVSDHVLAYAVRQFVQNLELAKSLEFEVHDGDRVFLPSTWENPEGGGLDVYGLAGPVRVAQSLMARLKSYSLELARAEFLRWPKSDDGIFARLRIWAAGQAGLLSPQEAAVVFIELSDTAFWDDQQKRDLLLALRSRWNDLAIDGRREIETKFLKTSFPWQGQVDKALVYDEISRVERLGWLVSQGLDISVEAKRAIEQLLEVLGEHAPNVEEAASSNAGGVFSIGTNTSPGSLTDLPIAEIIANAGDPAKIDFSERVVHDRFRGLVDAKPVKALSALAYVANRGEAPTAHWSSFLRAEGRKTDSVRMIGLIGARLVDLPNSLFDPILYPVSDWLNAVADKLYDHCPDKIGPLWEKCVDAIRRIPPGKGSRNSEHSWVDEALNSPVYNLVNTLLSDPALKSMRAGRGLPPSWKAKMDGILAVPGHVRCLALVLLSRRLNFLFHVDRKWTNSAILPAMKDEDAASDAFFDGFLSQNAAPRPPLFRKMKDSLLFRARTSKSRRSDSSHLAGILTFVWSQEIARRRQNLSDIELREVLIHGGPGIATGVLWQLRHSHQSNVVAADVVLRFFRSVWPLQKALRTEQISARLVDFMLESGALFPRLLPLILPRLTSCNGFDAFGLAEDGEGGLTDSYPAEVLSLLCKLLAGDPSKWPYATDRVLERLAKNPAVTADPRLHGLRQRLGRRFRS